MAIECLKVHLQSSHLQECGPLELACDATGPRMHLLPSCPVELRRPGMTPRTSIAPVVQAALSDCPDGDPLQRPPPLCL